MEQEYLIDSNILIGYLDNKLPENGMAFMNKVVNAIPNISLIKRLNSCLPYDSILLKNIVKFVNTKIK